MINGKKCTSPHIEHGASGSCDSTKEDKQCTYSKSQPGAKGGSAYYDGYCKSRLGNGACARCNHISALPWGAIIVMVFVIALCGGIIFAIKSCCNGSRRGQQNGRRGNDNASIPHVVQSASPQFASVPYASPMRQCQYPPQVQMVPAPQQQYNNNVQTSQMQYAPVASPPPQYNAV